MMGFERVYDLLEEVSTLDFSDFDVYYTECHCEPILMSEKCDHGQQMLIERLANPYELMGNTDAKRATRGKDEVEILDYDIHTADPAKYGKGYKMLEYSTIADPTSEQKVHHGYIVYHSGNRKVKEVYCDCKDFFFRVYAPYVKAGLATFNLDAKYKDYMMQTYGGKPHNKEWTKETNPEGNLFVCKHLYKVMDDIMDTDNFVKRLLDTDAEDERIRRDINGDEFGKNAEKPKKKAAVTTTKPAAKPAAKPIEPEYEEEPETVEPIEELPPDEPVEAIPEEEPEVEELPEELPPEEEEEPPTEAEKEFEDDLEEIEPAGDVKVNYPIEKKPAPPAKIGTGFKPKKNTDTV